MTMILSRPATPEELRAAAQVALTKDISPDSPELTRGIKGVAVNMMNKMFGGDVNRKVVLCYLFGEPGGILRPMSSKSLSDNAWKFIISIWLQPEKVDDQWTYFSAVPMEAAQLRQRVLLPLPLEEKDGEDKDKKSSVKSFVI